MTISPLPSRSDKSPDVEARLGALNRLMTHQANEAARLRRHMGTSHEGLASQIDSAFAAMRDENARMYAEVQRELNQFKRLLAYACNNALIDDSFDAETEIDG